jgi:Leucine-rich repeat (LRR) protein
MLPNLNVLSLANNKIEKIENLHTLSKLTELNLSYNHIEIIENLEELRTLEILSLYGNHIERIENMENLENLIIFSAGNNRIKTVKGVRLGFFLNLNHRPKSKLYRFLQIERLRFIKTLRSLNLQGNPIADQDFHLYIAVILTQLKYYAYVYIQQEEREKGAVLFR